MTSRVPPRLTRWRDRGTDRRALEERAALLADAARDVPPAAPEVLARVRVQVLAQRPASAAQARRAIGRFPVRARLALGLALLLVSMATARGASYLWRSYFHPAPVPAPTTTPLRRNGPAAARASRGASEPAIPPAPAPAVPAAGVSAETPTAGSATAPAGAMPRLGATDPEIARRPPRASTNLASAHAEATSPGSAPPVAATPEPAAVAPTHLAPAPPAAAAPETEARLLAQALTQLRQSNDPHATLATLDRHAQQFPHGVLESEARGIRIEAVMQLKDPRTALALLDAPPAAPDALGARLVIARAELRANADRCADAVSDFSWILDSASVTRGGDIDQRAWHGRALCLERLGLKARARADLATYLRLYPQGRFAAEAARLLDDAAGQTRP